MQFNDGCKTIKDIYLILGTSAYEMGTTELEAVTGYPFTFCANVSLDPSKYNSILPILSIASVDWTAAAKGDNIYNANAAQTSVVGYVLTICIYIVGGLKTIIPKVSWIAYQSNIHFRTASTLYGGIIRVNTPVSGATICADFKIKVG